MIRRSLQWILVLIGAVVALCAGLFYWNTDPELEPALKELTSLRKPNLERVGICLDGVSWSYIRSLQGEGYFRQFHPASKVIVTYPAMTNVSLSDIWHAQATPGYESLYFDRRANAFGGGAATYIGKR